MTGFAEPGAGRPETAERWSRALLVLGLVLLLVLVAYDNLHRSLWLDEAYALDTAGRSLAGVVRQSLRFEMQPPLYFLVLHLWLKISPTIEWARILSTVMVALTLWLLHRLARLLDLAPSPFSLPVVAALSPLVLWVAVTARCYAMVTLLITLSTYCFVRVWVLESERPLRDQVLFVVSAYLALLTFYYAGFVLAAQLLAGLLVSRRRRSLVVSGLLIGVLLLPWVPVILQQVAVHPNYNPPVAHASAISVLELVLGSLSYGVFMGVSLLGRTVVAVSLGAMLVAVVALRVWRGSAPWTRAETALAVVALVPFAVLAAARITHLFLVENRHYIVVTIPLLLLVALLLSHVRDGRIRAALAAVLTAFVALSAVSFERNRTDPEGWKQLVAYLTPLASPAEPILFVENDGEVPFRYYYRGPAHLYGIMRDFTGDTWTMEQPNILSYEGLRQRVAATVGPSHTFWLVARARPARWLLRQNTGAGWQVVERQQDTRGGEILDDFIGRDVDVLDARSFGEPWAVHARTSDRVR